ncbi:MULTISPECIES: glycosyltransferase family 2 protein [unclassified Frankia]
MNDHLVSEGLRPLERLEARTRPAAATEACPNKVQSTDLDSTDLVSVVVPTRDRSEILANCLRRLTEITYPAVEFLIVDNAPSSDATKRVVDSFAATDERFRHVPEPHPGLSRARNRVLALARGVSGASRTLRASRDSSARRASRARPKPTSTPGRRTGPPAASRCFSTSPTTSGTVRCTPT